MYVVWIVVVGVAGLVALLIFLFIVLDLAKSPKISADDILAVLSHVEWKTAREIAKEINVAKGVPANSLWGVISPVIYLFIGELEEEGLVIRRDRITISETEYVLRGRNYPPEFRLTDKGVRSRFERDKQEVTGSVSGDPVQNPI